MRYRRLRQSAVLRRMVKETDLRPENLIMPYFVLHGRGIRRPIPSMPGQHQLSIDELLKDVSRLTKSGVLAVILFGLPRAKDPLGREAYAESGIVQQAIRALKRKFPSLVVMADLCLCEYTNHGHCGVLKRAGTETVVDNDATLALLRATALAQAAAGADFVAPSGMMDGAVGAIRNELDRNGHTGTGILAYSAKYASAFYGPFREAARSAPKKGDRTTYQMDPGNIREAMKEIQQDLAEGADMVMVKPALSYLDVISEAKSRINVPLVAYNVSGEYAMVKAAERLGWMDGPRASLEVLTSIKRAGADLIITYHAAEAAAALFRTSR